MGKKERWNSDRCGSSGCCSGRNRLLFPDDIGQMIPIFDDGSSEDKVYVEKVSRIMNQYAGVSNRYNGVVETQDSYEVNVDSSRTISEIKVEVGDEVEEGTDSGHLRHQ